MPSSLALLPRKFPIGPRRIGLAAGLALAVAGCGRGPAEWRQTAPPQPSADQATGYIRPPRLTSARASADGGWLLTGTADAQDRVRLSSPGGDAYGATTDDHGQWTIAISAQPQTRLYGLSEVLPGRAVQAEGYIALTPRPGQAALLRAGVGALTIAPVAAALKVSAIDCDEAGGTVISGLARPGSRLHLSVDGGAPLDVQADADGRYSIALGELMKTGDHEVSVDSGADVAHAKFAVGPVEAAMSGLPYGARRQADGWRVDWITPGGGRQTTFLLD